MSRRRALGALGALLLAGGCGEVQPDRPSAPEPNPAAAADEPPAPVESERPAGPQATAPPDYPGVATMSPSQRRAYERGYRDCREGRYAPGDYAEAYRIGCAAAQELGPGEG